MTSHSIRLNIIACLLTIFIANISIAQDVVILKNDDGKTTKRNGVIESWTGNQLNLKTKTRVREIDTDRIVDVRTDWPAGLIDGRKMMASGDFGQAATILKQARETESRQWVKQIITSELVQCLDATDQTELAMIEFLRLYQDDSQTRFFHLIPLPWLLTKPYSEQGRLGTKILGSENKLLALMSASLLLTGSQRAQATQRLEQLASDADKRIAQLATTQLWRRELLTATEATVERWDTQINSLPDKLRAGPLVLLAQAQSRIGKSDLAMTNFMKLPILYPEKNSLAALALFRCTEILKDTGQDKLANSLEQELLQNFPTSKFAQAARQK